MGIISTKVFIDNKSRDIPQYTVIKVEQGHADKAENWTEKADIYLRRLRAEI